jgi:predicted PurR-regulated permease PerM
LGVEYHLAKEKLRRDLTPIRGRFSMPDVEAYKIALDLWKSTSDIYDRFWAFYAAVVFGLFAFIPTRSFERMTTRRYYVFIFAVTAVCCIVAVSQVLTLTVLHESLNLVKQYNQKMALNPGIGQVTDKIEPVPYWAPIIIHTVFWGVLMVMAYRNGQSSAQEAASATST